MKRLTTFCLLVLALGCGDESGDNTLPCVDALPETCTPLYEPIFDEVYKNTLEKGCAVAGGSCHSNTGGQGGLILEDPDVAYEHLLDVVHARVIPGDPDCSPLVKRLEATDSNALMPPGTQLSEPERCAIVEWIRLGALR